MVLQVLKSGHNTIYENMKIYYRTWMRETYCTFLLLKVHIGRQQVLLTLICMGSVKSKHFCIIIMHTSTIGFDRFDALF